jgi:hypothetical protein
MFYSAGRDILGCGDAPVKLKRRYLPPQRAPLRLQARPAAVDRALGSVAMLLLLHDDFVVTSANFFISAT